MDNIKNLETILSELGNDKKKFKIVLDKFIKYSIDTINNNEELREELDDIDNTYQTYIDDMNIQFWIKVKNGKIEFEYGVYKNPSVEVWLTKGQIINIIKGDISGSDAYIKGKIKARGSLTLGLRYIKLYRMFFKYINEKYDLNGFPG